jgi:hypothetical protein
MSAINRDLARDKGDAGVALLRTMAAAMRQASAG